MEENFVDVFKILGMSETDTEQTDNLPKKDDAPRYVRLPEQATQRESQNIQSFKLEISKGIKAGSDPYPLLLKAVQVIAMLTGERAFYIMHRDAMQGMGMLEQIPAEWERDSVNASLQRLEASRRNIDTAITAHKQWLDGQPISADTDTEDEYGKRIKKSFGAAFRFLDEHKHARTDEDWRRIAGSLSPYVDPLVVDLVVAAVSELEREYKEATGVTGDLVTPKL